VLGLGALFSIEQAGPTSVYVGFAAFAAASLSQYIKTLCLGNASLESSRATDVAGWMFWQSSLIVQLLAVAVSAAWGWWRSWSESLVAFSVLDAAFVFIVFVCAKCISS
jgi:hypothetical protein